VKGGISKRLAALPTMKLPDQNNVASIRKIYALLFFEDKLSPN
jgi:hypothetical protein